MVTKRFLTVDVIFVVITTGRPNGSAEWIHNVGISGFFLAGRNRGGHWRRLTLLLDWGRGVVLLVHLFDRPLRVFPVGMLHLFDLVEEPLRVLRSQ